MLPKSQAEYLASLEQQLVLMNQYLSALNQYFIAVDASIRSIRRATTFFVVLAILSIVAQGCALLVR